MSRRALVFLILIAAACSEKQGISVKSIHPTSRIVAMSFCEPRS